MKFIKLTFVIIVFSFLCNSCSDSPIPKPRAYPRIDFPALTYKNVQVSACNYSFDLADFAILRNDPYPSGDECWYNIHYPKFNATLHLSYRKIRNRDDLFKVINDSREMVYKHVLRADEIIENYISKPQIHGIFYEIQGSTATNAQFFVTDSTANFLRGSLYFNQVTDADSIQPVLQFLKKDMLHVLSTLGWKE